MKIKDIRPIMQTEIDYMEACFFLIHYVVPEYGNTVLESALAWRYLARRFPNVSISTLYNGLLQARIICMEV